MSGYAEDGDYDHDAQVDALRLIIARCPDLAAEAATALRVPGDAPRQIRLDRLIPRALEVAGAWSASDRELLAGIMRDAGDVGASRTRTLRFRVTPEEETLLKDSARAAGQTLSDFLRDRAFAEES